MTHISWLNFDTTRVLIGQEPMGYCAGKLTLKPAAMLVYRTIAKKAFDAIITQNLSDI